jgi:hypothetical protein
MSLDAMKQALEFIDSVKVHPTQIATRDALHTALRAAIEQAEKPVAWYDSESGITDFHSFKPVRKPSSPTAEWIPLYTAPRQWQGLTDEEVHQGFCHVEYETPNDWNTDPDDWCQQFARYLEAKLKEKNT